MKFERPGESPAVVEFCLPREQMAHLSILPFTSANKLDQDLWSFVYFCRNGGQNHGRTTHALSRPYDIVCGPVVLWEEQVLKKGSDQVSFHTLEAQKLLNLPGRRRIVKL